MPHEGRVRRSVVAPPMPRRPVVEKMCASCPFGPDVGRPKIDVSPAELERFRQTAIAGEFYCHGTVLEDSRTTYSLGGDPSPRVQPHFKVCRGGWELKLKERRMRESESSCGHHNHTPCGHEGACR